jgi:hypothetical protein
MDHAGERKVWGRWNKNSKRSTTPGLASRSPGYAIGELDLRLVHRNGVVAAEGDVEEIANVLPWLTYRTMSVRQALLEAGVTFAVALSIPDGCDSINKESSCRKHPYCQETRSY